MRTRLPVLLAALLVTPLTLRAQARGAAALGEAVEGLGTSVHVLMIGAHPDDEDTQLITYLAKGRHIETAYLSLTRGDGGQNLIGPELGASLGVIRTQELLAARRIDGGVQFFTRANDFGFSKSYEETLALWNRDDVLADVVRVIRTFRPDVLITRFSLKPGGTHGHHTASAMLAVEAFRLAGDPHAYPDQIAAGLAPWQPKRVFWNAWPASWRPGADGVDPAHDPAVISLDVGGYDPLLGESYGEIAARSRTQHKSQGFGSIGSRGSAIEYFKLLAGEPAATGARRAALYTSRGARAARSWWAVASRAARARAASVFHSRSTMCERCGFSAPTTVQFRTPAASSAR